MPAARRSRITPRRSPIGAQSGSYSRRISSRSVVKEKLTRKQLRGIGFERGELPPAAPVFRFQAAINPHGRDVAITASEAAIAGGSERVGESRLGDEAAGLAEDALRICMKNSE